jgi:hypothetical protein
VSFLTSRPAFILGLKDEDKRPAATDSKTISLLVSAHTLFFICPCVPWAFERAVHCSLFPADFLSVVFSNLDLLGEYKEIGLNPLRLHCFDQRISG